MRYLLTLLLLLLAATVASSATVNIAWKASKSDNVAGYKIYYRAGSGELPLDGTEAVEGSSPVDVGDVTEATLTFPVGPKFFFRATAYDSAGDESELSNQATTKPLAPSDLMVAATTTTTTTITTITTVGN